MKTYCLLLTVVLLGGCASQGLTYRPAVNPTNVPISASHHVKTDRFYIEIASGGFRVESVDLVLADGTDMSAEGIHRPAVGRASSGRGGMSVGIGIGGLAGQNNAVGGGVGIGTSPREVMGNTTVIFPVSKVGPGPWRLRVKLVSFAPVEIDLPALATPEAVDG